MVAINGLEHCYCLELSNYHGTVNVIKSKFIDMKSINTGNRNSNTSSTKMCCISSHCIGKIGYEKNDKTSSSRTVNHQIVNIEIKKHIIVKFINI